MPNRTNSFETVFNKLNEMERSQSIDPSIVEDFKLLEKHFSEIEKECVSATERKLEDAFLLFHVMRSSRMILERAHSRFIDARERHENPVIVDLSKMVVPRIYDMYNLVIPIFHDKKHVLSSSERSAILTRLKILRDIASTTSMLPSVDDEKKGILKSELRSRFHGLADSLQATVDEE